MSPVRAFALSFALIVVVVAPSIGRAEPAPVHERSLSETLEGAAKEAYASARILFNNGDYAGALTKYNQAYQLSRDPRLLFDMAICEKDLRRYARMQRLLEQYERDAGTALTPDHKAAVDAALAAVRHMVASVTVSVNVPGATVSIDGEAVGVSPLSSPVLADLGRHTIAAAKSGYEAAAQAIEVTGGNNQGVTLALTSQVHAGHLIVTAERDATIEVDGRPLGTDRYEGALPVGSHELRVTAPGKVPYVRELAVHDGELRTIDVTLTAEAHGKPAPVWPWIVGGALAAVGLAVGGYFLFRPQDETRPVQSGTLYALQF